MASCFAQEDESIVRFSNGDQLSGTALGLSLEQLNWKSEVLKEPAEFDLKQVVDLSMPASLPKDASKAAHEATLRLTNGDTVKGQLVGLSDDEIRISTWFAGELSFRRVIVKSVEISRLSEVFYRGPTSMEEWTRTGESDSWSYKSGALHSTGAGGIAKNVDFPAECRISFEAAWRGAFRPRIVLFSDDITSQTPKSGYEMVFQGNSVHVKKAGNNSWLGHSSNTGDLRQNEKARIEIRASIKSGKILLFVDGEFVEMWQDDDLDSSKFGKGFHINTQDNAPLRISEIKVSGWDGYTDDVPNGGERLPNLNFRGGLDFEETDNESMAQTESQSEGRMQLLNGDSIDGEILEIEDEMILVKTPLAEAKFPVARLKNILMKPADMETPKRYKGDVRATLADGSRMVFRLDRVEGEKLIGFSQNFGDAQFLKNSFKQIEFNIYDRGLEEIRLRDDW
ncbi:hypothetical protein ACFSSA_15620 [Luteolibacter algae]|uniref:Uncharacterized protein n=1 Tax=Luteolibacter algae TaxID=454151 RepID=A0ABW5DBA0_9BACT